jgi:hypothetical protein
MAEISKLMRESERLLLEMTMIDRLVEQQRRVVSELEKLEPPREEQPAGSDAGGEPQRTEQQQREEKAKRDELRAKQQELRRRLEDLFRNQDDASRQSVEQLEKLLRNLPRGGGGMGEGPPDQKKPSGPEPEDDAKKKEREQNDPKQGEERREPTPEEQRRSQEERKREEEKQNAQSRLAIMDAWMARLPPAQLERISRNDFSGFPPRYRRLLREYTQLRAKQEAEKERAER